MGNKITPRLLLGIIFSYGCSVQPSDPGLCDLKCGNAKIAGADPSFLIEPQREEYEITCNPTQANVTEKGVALRFLVKEKFGGEEDAGFRPVPSISIDPIFFGNFAPSATYNPDANKRLNPDTNKNEIPDQYKGIGTKIDDWCSDSCGVVSFDVGVLCPAVGTSSSSSFQVHSGALFSPPVVINIQTEEAI